MMYFSGVSSDKEAKAPQGAGVQHFLCDPHDLLNVPDSVPYVALDSGAIVYIKPEATVA